MRAATADSEEPSMPQPFDPKTYAADNGLLYSAVDQNPKYPGSIFAEWSNRLAIDHIRSTSGRFFDVGEFDYDMPAGRTTATMRWGFIAVHLDNALPHIVLEAQKHDNWFTGGLPLDLDSEQKLSLEGDFDKHFTLYCPADFETDALYIFAPDLMALLIDEAGGKHVEIIGEWLFVYWQLGFGAQWFDDYERLFRIIDLVGAKAVRQTKRYVNDRPSRINRVTGTSRYWKVFWITLAVVGAVVVVSVVISVATTISRF
jgi:hypothetical protein